jgi:hypothetical protein
MRTFVSIIVLVAVLFVATVAADTTTVKTTPTTPNSKITLGVAILNPFDIRGINYYPVGYSVGFGLATSVSSKVTVGVEVGVKTNLGLNQPCPQVIITSGQKINSTLGLGEALVIRYLPRFQGMKADGAFVSLAVGPQFPLNGFTVATTVSLDHNFLNKTWNEGFAVKAIFPLTAF